MKEWIIKELTLRQRESIIYMARICGDVIDEDWIDFEKYKDSFPYLGYFRDGNRKVLCVCNKGQGGTVRAPEQVIRNYKRRCKAI